MHALSCREYLLLSCTCLSRILSCGDLWMSSAAAMRGLESRTMRTRPGTYPACVQARLQALVADSHLRSGSPHVGPSPHILMQEYGATLLLVRTHSCVAGGTCMNHHPALRSAHQELARREAEEESMRRSTVVAFDPLEGVLPDAGDEDGSGLGNAPDQRVGVARGHYGHATCVAPDAAMPDEEPSGQSARNMVAGGTPSDGGRRRITWGEDEVLVSPS